MHQQPSLLYGFLRRVRQEDSEKYFNLCVHLLNVVSGPPIGVCVNQLLRICQITNTPVSYNRCHTLLNRIRFYHNAQRVWCSVQQFSKEDPVHEEMLMKLWTTLKPNETLDSRLTRKWIDIGFQGVDPATDFRGAGLLGLKQLVTLCTSANSREKALELYRASQVQEQWFFFAVTGINITQKLLNSLNNSKDQTTRVDLDALILDAPFPVPATSAEMAKLMDVFYRDIFERFTTQWTAKKPNIMEFTQFLDDIYSMDFAKRVPDLIAAYNKSNH